MKKIFILLSVLSLAILYCISSFRFYPPTNAPEGMTVREHALKQSRSKDACPNLNFMFCADGGLFWKITTLWLQNNYTDEEMCRDYNYHSCINTATSFYNPHFTAALCANFVDNPSRWHFKEVEKSQAQPGDLIIFFDKTGKAWHAVILDHFTNNDVIFNHSNGKWRKTDYKHCDRLSRWRRRVSFVKYYSYIE